MRMKRILQIAILCLAVVGWAGCSDEEEKLLTAQQEKIRNFLTNTLKLKSYEEAMDPAAEDNTPFYTVHGEWAYRWIENYYDQGRRDLPLVCQGSRVGLTLSLYEFTQKKIDERTVPLFTNDPALRDHLERAGLNTTYWSFETYYVEVGAGNTINGLELALDGCRLNDRVEVYMTFSEAYGRDWLATVAPESGLVVMFTVNSVE